MKIRILEKSGNRLRMLIEGAPLALVNAIRRAAMAEVPTMAVDEVFFIENNTAMYDEIIAHRLGLVPLTSEAALEKYRSPEECADCTDCENCYASLYIEAEAVDSPKIIYSGDLKSTDPDVRPVYGNMPLVYLAPGQRISLEARARLGRGKEHAKWMPVSVAAHKYLPILHFDFTKAGREEIEECLECVRGASRRIAEELEEKGKGSREVLEDVNTSIYYYCSKTACKGLLEIEYRDDAFILTIESTGALPPERIILEAVRIVGGKASELASELEKLAGGGSNE